MTAMWMALSADMVAIAFLAYGVYFRRHFRSDLLLAYVSLNAGVFVVTALLTSEPSALGLGLGLFGILSIIRLRSTSLTQEEVAYYFVSLAMGLIGGLHPNPPWMSPLLIGLLVAVVFVVDHPRLRAHAQRQVITLDHAYPDHVQLRAALEQLLGAEVRQVRVCELDMVRDTTIADVRYTVGASLPRRSSVRPLVGEPR